MCDGSNSCSVYTQGSTGQGVRGLEGDAADGLEVGHLDSLDSAKMSGMHLK